MNNPLNFHELHRSYKETERNVNLLKAIILDLKHGKFPAPYQNVVDELQLRLNSLINDMNVLLTALERERASANES